MIRCGLGDLSKSWTTETTSNNPYFSLLKQSNNTISKTNALKIDLPNG
jgi:hypothetical protein